MPIIVNAAGNATLKDITFMSKTDTHSFNIKYPKVMNTNHDKKINEAIEAAISNIKTQSLNLLENSLDNYIDLTSVYEVKHNRENILILLFKSTINYGGAHPINLQSALTINTRTGEIYSLKDLFPKEVDYVALINEEIKKQIKSDYYKNTEFYKFESIDKEQSFYIDNGMLVIFFDQYAYAPRNFGFAEFIMPFYNKDFKLPQ